MPYSPWPTSYETGPCFSEGEGAYVGTGFFSACLMGDELHGIDMRYVVEELRSIFSFKLA